MFEVVLEAESPSSPDWFFLTILPLRPTAEIIGMHYHLQLEGLFLFGVLVLKDRIHLMFLNMYNIGKSQSHKNLSKQIKLHIPTVSTYLRFKYFIFRVGTIVYLAICKSFLLRMRSSLTTTRFSYLCFTEDTSKHSKSI